MRKNHMKWIVEDLLLWIKEKISSNLAIKFKVQKYEETWWLKKYERSAPIEYIIFLKTKMNIWFQQNGTTFHTAWETIDLLRQKFEDSWLPIDTLIFSCEIFSEKQEFKEDIEYWFIENMLESFCGRLGATENIKM